jgi:acetyl-CoA synthetase
MLEAGGSYDTVRDAFRWRIPARYNIAVDVCDRQPADRPALIVEGEAGALRTYSFGAIRALSNRCANLLRAHGVSTGDRVGVLLSQGMELPVVHLAAYKLGAVALPLFALFGPDALAYRLNDSEAKVVVTDRLGAEKIESIRRELPSLAHVFIVDGAADGLWPLLDRASNAFTPVDTRADDPALILYTSGTTGPPKGALHAHRVVLGHLPGVSFPHEFFPQPGDLFWTPADWAWAGGLLNVLLSSWHHGVCVLAHRARKFDPEAAFALIARHGVRNAFLPPTALKLMRQMANPRARHAIALRTVGSGGEPLGAELIVWGRAALGVTINEFYGQTECNLVLGNCAGIMPVKPGSMGRPIPGHAVAVIDDNGAPVPPGASGAIAIRRPDPVMFLGYWKNEAATAAKFIGEWMTTGDLGRVDEDGYFWFLGREDDVITSGAYRIGPGEIEDCLLKHPAVALAAAVGVPDPLRTEIVKAFVVTKPGHAGDADLARAIQDFVRTRLAAHEYPREIEFVSELPMTATGKIVRRVLRQRERDRSASKPPEASS